MGGKVELYQGPIRRTQRHFNSTIVNIKAMLVLRWCHKCVFTLLVFARVRPYEQLNAKDLDMEKTLLHL